MKIKMLIASALLISSFTVSATSELCNDIGELTAKSADARDSGVSQHIAEDVVKGSAKDNQSAEMIALAVVRMVYARSDMTREQLRNVAVNLCEKNGM